MRTKTTSLSTKDTGQERCRPDWRSEGIKVTLGDIATAAGVLIAIVFGALSWRQARRADAKAEAANQHASAANSIAQQALEVAKQQFALEERAAVKEPWRLTRLRGDQLQLTNASVYDAMQVLIHPPEHTVTRGDFEHELVGAGSSATFMISRTWGSGSELTVTWVAMDGSPQHWTGALPPKP